MIRSPHGFTLIELMVAMFIAAFGLLVVMGTLVATVRMAAETEIDIALDIAFEDGLEETDQAGFSPEVLGHPVGAIANGEPFAWTDVGSATPTVLPGTSDYAVSVSFNNLVLSRWYSVRPVYPAGYVPLPADPPLLPGAMGLRYITIHALRSPDGRYFGNPSEGDTQEFILIGITHDNGIN